MQKHLEDPRDHFIEPVMRAILKYVTEEPLPGKDAKWHHRLEAALRMVPRLIEVNYGLYDVSSDPDFTPPREWRYPTEVKAIVVTIAEIIDSAIPFVRSIQAKMPEAFRTVCVNGLDTWLVGLKNYLLHGDTFEPMRDWWKYNTTPEAWITAQRIIGPVLAVVTAIDDETAVASQVIEDTSQHNTVVKSVPSKANRKDQYEWLARAMLHVKDHPDWSDAEIARKTGVDKGTLSRNKTYKNAAESARAPKTIRPKGHIVRAEKGKPSDVEAIAPESIYIRMQCRDCKDTIRVKPGTSPEDAICDKCAES